MCPHPSDSLEVNSIIFESKLFFSSVTDCKLLFKSVTCFSLRKGSEKQTIFCLDLLGTNISNFSIKLFETNLSLVFINLEVHLSLLDVFRQCLIEILAVHYRSEQRYEDHHQHEVEENSAPGSVRHLLI